jgi:hypothetical protein
LSSRSASEQFFFFLLFFQFSAWKTKIKSTLSRFPIQSRPIPVHKKIWGRKKMFAGEREPVSATDRAQVSVR